jgi:UDP-N-acetylglucosamine 2-epimerase (non-hydrolysing)
VGKFSKKILTIFGTRPEIIKLAPVIQQLDACGKLFQTVNVTSAQHTDLLYPFVRLFGIRIDQDLQIMEPNQTPNKVCSRVLASLEPILAQQRPDMILVQGDTTTAMSGALAGFHRRIPVAHVEAGLRTGDAYNPYPEEMNRRIITRLATYHFAATPRNRDTLLSEGVPHGSIFVTGNPVLDSLKTILERSATTPVLEEVLKATKGLRRIIVTTHRRESFGEVMAENLRVLRNFIDQYEDIGLIFPVHPSPRSGNLHSRRTSQDSSHSAAELRTLHCLIVPCLAHRVRFRRDTRRSPYFREAPTCLTEKHGTTGGSRVGCSTPRRRLSRASRRHA